MLSTQSRSGLWGFWDRQAIAQVIARAVEFASYWARVHFFCARVALLASRAPPPFLAALSPCLAARWRRRPASRARRRRACCLPCVLARPAARPLPAACAVHGEFLPAAEVCCCCQKAHAHALPCRRRLRWGLRVCVSARVRCRGCALCGCARARSLGLRSVARTFRHAAWVGVPVPLFLSRTSDTY